jgi:hypothetical protein
VGQSDDDDAAGKAAAGDGEDHAAIDRILEICAAHGATAKVSSIHVNAWFGDYDKAGMLLALLAEEFGLEPAEARRALRDLVNVERDARLSSWFTFAGHRIDTDRASLARITGADAPVTDLLFRSVM